MSSNKSQPPDLDHLKVFTISPSELLPLLHNEEERELMNLAKRIRAKRETLELTQEQLTTTIGLSPQYVSLIEQNKRVPSVSSLARFAEELEVMVDYLITGKEAVISDTIPTIRADGKLTIEAKKALIATVREFYRSKEGR